MSSVSTILGPGGKIAARLPHYEHRPQQLAMAEGVARALTEGHHLIAEAGTGVGKSFAYLVPAIQYVTDRRVDAAVNPGGHAGLQSPDDEPPRRRIIVSTHTISLQEQLLNKDLPLLRSVIPEEFTAVLVKGRGNYISLRRMNTAAERRVEPLLAGRRNPRPAADHRLVEENGGRLAERSARFSPAWSVWDEVQSDSGNCLGRKCPTHKDCFYYRARRRVQNAQILIVNHALFFSDLALRRIGASILPDYDAVIFDEAHTLEQVAGDHLGLSVTSGQVQYLLNKLYNDRTNKGLLVTPQAPRRAGPDRSNATRGPTSSSTTSAHARVSERPAAIRLAWPRNLAAQPAPFAFTTRPHRKPLSPALARLARERPPGRGRNRRAKARSSTSPRPTIG